jgi:hypothetical protein
VALVEGLSKENPLVWEARLEGMAPEIDGKVYLTDIVAPCGKTAAAGDIARVKIIKTDAYDLIGRVAEILTRPSGRPMAAEFVPPTEKLYRIATGAPLRVVS